MGTTVTRSSPRRAGAVSAQRALDLVLGSLLLLLVLPLMALVALAVRLDGPGPVLHAQTHLGLGGRPFRILKFRSMVPDAEADGRPRWAEADDPRVTRVGRVIRLTRMDELPQLWNVLRGDMSLVGPRPEPWDVAVALGEQIPGYGERHRVRPGLTGLCQISPAYYDFGTVEKSARKLELDLRYVASASLLTDLAILLRTVPALIRKGGMA